MTMMPSDDRGGEFFFGERRIGKSPVGILSSFEQQTVWENFANTDSRGKKKNVWKVSSWRILKAWDRSADRYQDFQSHDTPSAASHSALKEGILLQK
jgi:hypothetical protein